MLVAGIVTYNPDINRLAENLESIASQVDRIIVVDNGSTEWDSIAATVEHYSALSVRNATNLGIASALNQMATKALELGSKWLLTLDQDSVCSEGLVADY